MIRSGWEDCDSYERAVDLKKHNPKYPLFPVGRVYREGTNPDHFCPNCGSSTSRSGFLSLFGKRFCLNNDCLYHYFDIRKDTESLNTIKEVIEFPKNRLREEKFKNII